jgi:predicted DNA-binding transcriptional regulator AlpA
MKVHSFTLVLAGITEINGEVEDRLFGAGCDDALLGIRDGVAFLDFDRESDSMLDAIVTAISNVEQSGLDVNVIRVEPDDLVTASEIAERTGRSRESIRLLAAGQRGGGGFPPPVRGLKSRMRLWRWAEVIAWMTEHEGSAPSAAVHNAQTIAAINGALELRRHAPDGTDNLLRALAG